MVDSHQIGLEVDRRDFEDKLSLVEDTSHSLADPVAFDHILVVDPVAFDHILADPVVFDHILVVDPMAYHILVVDPVVFDHILVVAAVTYQAADILHNLEEATCQAV